jgi:ammonia channel protein AmtB
LNFKEFEKMPDARVAFLIKTYDKNIFQEKEIYFSVPLAVIGAFILWISWLFFNCCAGFSITNNSNNNYPPKTVLNTLIGSSTSAIVVLLFKPLIMKGA